ncbi:hypothetical protein OC861_003640 [Tilletia horrida]|nr:hypothetical protein OC861_003640 [Tilletia horrida]
MSKPETSGKAKDPAVTVEALQDARSCLVQMLALLDPAAAAQYVQSSSAQGILQPNLSESLSQDGTPGLIHTLPALLAPILQPIHAQQQAAASAAAANANAAVQQQQAGTLKPPLQQGPPAFLGNAIRSALKKSADLSKLAKDSSSASSDAKRKPAEAEPKELSALAPALQLSIRVLKDSHVEHKEGNATLTEVSDQDVNPLLILRKRKRQAEQSDRLARRRRVTDTIRFLNFSIQSNAQASQLPDAKPNACSLPSEVCFPAPPVQNIDSTPDQLLSARTLQAYIRKVQSHPRWKQPKLASGQQSQQAADKSDAVLLPQRKLHIRLHNAAAPNPSLSRTISLLSTSSANRSGRVGPHAFGSAGILAQIEGVLQVLLTLGVRSPGNEPEKAYVIVTQANVRGAFESGPMVPRSQHSSAATPACDTLATAHLPSASPVYRAISAEMMAYLTHERQADRHRGAGEDATDDMSSAFRELGRALMFVRALRTVEDHSMPAPPPLPLSSSGDAGPTTSTQQQQEGDPNQRSSEGPEAVGPQKDEPILGFVGFFDPEAQDGASDTTDTAAADSSATARRQRSSGTWASGAHFGQAPIRWAWCAPHTPAASSTTGTTAAGSTGEDEPEKRGGARCRGGEWLAFNLGAASTAPVPMAEAHTNGNSLMGFIGPGWNAGTLGGVVGPATHGAPAAAAVPPPPSLLTGGFGVGGGSIGVMGGNFNAANMAMSLPLGMPLPAPQAPVPGMVGLGTVPMQVLGGFS